MKLNLFIVGAAKCGTTFLNQLLTTHALVEGIPNDIWEDKNNLNYNNKDYIKKYYNFNNKYKFFLNCSPFYSVLKHTAAQIYNYNSNSKIIFCIRNHESRILSHINMERQWAKEKRHLTTIINTELKNIQKDVKTYNRRLYIKRTLYHEQLERFTNLFGKDNIFIFNLDNYKLSEIYKFLNIEKNNVDLDKLFKRKGITKKSSEIQLLKNHKGLQTLINQDKLLLKQNYNIII